MGKLNECPLIEYIIFSYFYNLFFYFLYGRNPIKAAIVTPPFFSLFNEPVCLFFNLSFIWISPGYGYLKYNSKWYARIKSIKKKWADLDNPLHTKDFSASVYA